MLVEVLMNKKLCPVCNERPIRVYCPEYNPPECLLCYNKRYNAEQLEKSKIRYRQKAEKKEIKIKEKIEDHAKEVNQKWLEREYKKQVPTEKQRFRNTQGHAYVKEPSYLKKFKSVRG
jgi:hypothetical protein